MGVITIRNIRLYAYHGCLEEEARIGGQYVVDVRIETDFSEAAANDNLSKTVDYCDVFEIVKQEMQIRSRLVEHVANRISNSLLRKLKRIESVKVRVTKIAPPVNGDVQHVSVTIEALKK